jgi:Holliday junction resolvase RusA-like endonuclease
MDSLIVTVDGRPAPQGSKKRGAAGQMREASPYLAAWRAAVKTAVYRAYAIGGVEPDVLPLLRGPVVVNVVFRLPPGRRVDAEPDIDKLQRSTFDALTDARVWEDDGRIVSVVAGKRHALDGETLGAHIEVRAA